MGISKFYDGDVAEIERYGDVGVMGQDSGVWGSCVCSGSKAEWDGIHEIKKICCSLSFVYITSWQDSIVWIR